MPLHKLMLMPTALAVRRTPTNLPARSDSTTSHNSLLQMTNPAAAVAPAPAPAPTPTPTTPAQAAADDSYDTPSNTQPAEAVQLVRVGDAADQDANGDGTTTVTGYNQHHTHHNADGDDNDDDDDDGDAEPRTSHAFVEVLPQPSGGMAGGHTVASHKQLKNMGIMAALAIGLHNLPEGLATFVGTLASPTLGVTLALAIAMHNIPEGVCIALPIYFSTGSRVKGFLWCAVSALAEPVGGTIGLIVLRASADAHGNIPDLVYGLLFGVVSGMMVYISMREMLPTAMRYDPKNKWTMPFCFLGMAVMAASLLLFAA